MPTHLTEQYLLPFAPGVILGKDEEIKKALGRRATHLNLQEKSLRTLQGIGVCSNLKCVYAYNNHITSLQNVFNGIENLSLLYLDNNDLSDLTGLEDIGKTLTKLYISYNQLTEIGLPFLACTKLQELYIYHQRLPTPDTSFRFHPLAIQSLAPTLTILDISHNNIKDNDLQYLYPLKNLQDINLAKNQLINITTICDFIAHLPNIAKLDIRGNPVTNPAISGAGGAYKGAIINAASNSINFTWLDGQVIKARYRRFVAGLAQMVIARQEDDEYREKIALRMAQLSDNDEFGIGNNNIDSSAGVQAQNSIQSTTSSNNYKNFNGGIAAGTSLYSLGGHSLYMGGGEEDDDPNNNGVTRIRDRYGNWSFRFWDPTQGNPLIKQYARQQQKLFGSSFLNPHHSSSSSSSNRGPAIPPKKNSRNMSRTKLDPLSHHRAILQPDPETIINPNQYYSNNHSQHQQHHLYTENSTSDSYSISSSNFIGDDGDHSVPSSVIQDQITVPTTSDPILQNDNKSSSIPAAETIPNVATDNLLPTTTTEEPNTTIEATNILPKEIADLNGPGPDEDDEVRVGSDSRIKEDANTEESNDNNNNTSNHSTFLRELEGSDSLGEVANSSARDPIDSTNAEDLLGATLVPRSRGTPGHHLVGALSTVAESTGEVTDTTNISDETLNNLPSSNNTTVTNTAKPPRPEQFTNNNKPSSTKASTEEESKNAAAMAYAAYKAQLALNANAIGGSEGFVSRKPVIGVPWQEAYIPARTPSDYVRTSRFRDSGYASFGDKVAAERKVAASLISRAKDLNHTTNGLSTTTLTLPVQTMNTINASTTNTASNRFAKSHQSITNKNRSTIQPLKSKTQLPALGTTSLASVSLTSLPNMNDPINNNGMMVTATTGRRGSGGSFITLGSEITVDYNYGQVGSGVPHSKSKNKLSSSSSILINN